MYRKFSVAKIADLENIAPFLPDDLGVFYSSSIFIVLISLGIKPNEFSSFSLLSMVCKHNGSF